MRQSITDAAARMRGNHRSADGQRRTIYVNQQKLSLNQWSQHKTNTQQHKRHKETARVKTHHLGDNRMKIIGRTFKLNTMQYQPGRRR